MGQRTQIIVIKENNKGEVRKTVWHHQWGFGRIMYLALMSLYIGDYNKDTWAKGYDFFNTSFPLIPKLTNVTDEVPKDILEQANVNDLASIRQVIDYCDNNNGAMVVYIKENPTENYLTSQFKVGFLMGLEDEYYTSTYDNKTYNERNIGEKAFSRWLTPVEYGRINGGNKYSDEDFIEMVYKFCEYFKIETLKEDKSVEENKKESQETNDGETDKTDSSDNNEKIYTPEKVLGRRLITRIQMGPFDAENGEITKIKVVDGQTYFYWNFYGCGWYTRDELCEEARKLIDSLTDREKMLIGINRCKNEKK